VSVRHRLFSFLDSVLGRADFRISRFPRDLRNTPSGQLELGIKHAISDHVLRSMSSGHAFEFVQIGAHEASGDAEPSLLSAVCRHRGVLVEPQPALAAALRDRFKSDPGMQVVECAVGDSKGALPFYFVDDPLRALPDWVSQIASFDKSHLEKFIHQVPRLREYLREVQVEVDTPDGICRRHGIERLDLLMIDVEGWDWNVIRLFPFERIRVELVVFEHRHLSREHRCAAVRRLLSLGFRVQVLSNDVVGVAGR
jgi:FkbM family methyltransferase